jgi:hypothetical protein
MQYQADCSCYRALCLLQSYVVCALGLPNVNLVFLSLGALQSLAAFTLSMVLRHIHRCVVIGKRYSTQPWRVRLDTTIISSLPGILYLLCKCESLVSICNNPLGHSSILFRKVGCTCFMKETDFTTARRLLFLWCCFCSPGSHITYYVLPVAAVGFAFHTCLLLVLLLWKPSGDDPALFYVISAAWGVCNAIWETLNFSEFWRHASAQS